MSYYDSDETDRAANAYFRWVARTGRFLQQPCRYSSSFDPKAGVVSLENCNGVLAQYKICEAGRLRRLPDLATV